MVCRGMASLSIVLLITCVSTIWSCRYPSWPGEFRWSYAGPVDGWACTRILEVADPNTWNDNYFCHKSLPGIAGVGMRWNSAGNIIESSRSSHTEMFYKKAVQKICVKSTKKHLQRRLYLVK